MRFGSGLVTVSSEPRAWVLQLGAIILLSVSGCTPSLERNPVPVAQKKGFIINGQEDLAHLAVGLLTSDQDGQKFHCTATLIGSRTILTAAHCVVEPGTFTFKLGETTYPVDNLIPHPQFQTEVETPGFGKVNINDIAVAVLREDVKDVSPVLLTNPLPHLQDKIKMVGLGMSKSEDNSTIGVKRSAFSTISKIEQECFLFGTKTDPTGGNTCYGDSGGPTFFEVLGRDHLLGVHSMGDQDCKMYGYDMVVGFYDKTISTLAGDNLGQSMVDTNPPVIIVLAPSPEAQVPPSFEVKVSAVDDFSGLASIDLYLDGKFYMTTPLSPAKFPITSLSEGKHQVRLEVADNMSRTDSVTFNVTVSKSASSSTMVDPNTPWANYKEPGTGPQRVTIEGGCAMAGQVDGAGAWWQFGLGVLPLVLGRVRLRRRAQGRTTSR
jgi:hypothetical protein